MRIVNSFLKDLLPVGFQHVHNRTGIAVVPNHLGPFVLESHRSYSLMGKLQPSRGFPAPLCALEDSVRPLQRRGTYESESLESPLHPLTGSL